jgi:hypothetical protein
MVKSATDSRGLSLKRAKSEARSSGIVSAILLVVIFVIPVKIVQVSASLGIAVTGCYFVFYGSTVISMTLEGESRRWFQILVSVAVPILLSLYFIKDAPSLTLRGIFGHMLSAWYLIPVGLIGYVSWAAADQLNREHPFRGFLIACAVIFVICFMGHRGIYSEYDDYENSFMHFDEEAAKRAAETGRYFGRFLVYVVTSYVAMLMKMHRRRTPNKPMQSKP